MVDIGRRRPRIALALQGGGAHGAYAWGVVERLHVLTELKEISAIEPCNDPRLRVLSRINLHLISPPASIGQRGGASKIDMRWSVLLELRALGREVAEAWLQEDGTLIGKMSSMVQLPEEVAEVIG